MEAIGRDIIFQRDRQIHEPTWHRSSQISQCDPDFSRLGFYSKIEVDTRQSGATHEWGYQYGRR